MRPDGLFVMLACVLIMNLTNFTVSGADNFPMPNEIVIWQGGGHWVTVQADDPRRDALMEVVKALFSGVDGIRKTSASKKEIEGLKKKGAVELRYSPPVRISFLLPAGSQLLNTHGTHKTSSVLLPYDENYYAGSEIFAGKIVLMKRIPDPAGRKLRAVLTELLPIQSLPTPSEIIVWTGGGQWVTVQADDSRREPLLKAAKSLLAGVGGVRKTPVSGEEIEELRARGAVLELRYTPPVTMAALLPFCGLDVYGTREARSVLLPYYEDDGGFPNIIAGGLVWGCLVPKVTERRLHAAIVEFFAN